MLSWNVARSVVEVKDVPGSVGCVMSGGHTAVGATSSQMIPNEHIRGIVVAAVMRNTKHGREARDEN